MPQALGQGFLTNPLPCPQVARGCPGGRPPGMADDTRISSAVKVAREEGSNLFSSKGGHHGNQTTAHLQAPVSTTLRDQCVEWIFTKECGRDGGREKSRQVSRQCKHNT